VAGEIMPGLEKKIGGFGYAFHAMTSERTNRMTE